MKKADREENQSKGRYVVPLGIALVSLVLGSCGNNFEGAPAPAPMVGMPWNGPIKADGTAGFRSGGAAVNRNAIDGILNNPQSRSGLATGWGDEVNSKMAYTSFVRASSKPTGKIAVIRYNDSDGASSMGVNTKYKSSGLQSAAGGLVEWGVKSGWGMLPSYWWRGDRMVIGRKGKSYSLIVKNKSANRVEVVLSVDGLDVVDGKAGSVSKKGYVIAPGKTLEVKGFRTSTSAVAAFKFSSVGASYANFSGGDTRNVGVMGMAVYHDKASWQEAQQRGGASPFAEAPGNQVRR
ncbi:hypothetical protein N9A86_02770 [Akkermansiaceae bacterium]|nr:hypothetical protein [Akkermansiaceae bacterium]